MSCCGQRRAEFTQANNPAGRDPAAPAGAHVQLEFTRRTSIAVRGPVTGILYRFQEGSFSQPVDSRDAVNLIASGYFRRI
jgi:hypothetical protein